MLACATAACLATCRSTGAAGESREARLRYAKSRPSQAAPKRRTATKVAPAPESTSLDTPKSESPRRRQLSRRNTDAQIERALTGQHFKHINEGTLANRLVGGKTIREALREKMHELALG